MGIILSALLTVYVYISDLPNWSQVDSSIRHTSSDECTLIAAQSYTQLSVHEQKNFARYYGAVGLENGASQPTYPDECVTLRPIPSVEW